MARFLRVTREKMVYKHLQMLSPKSVLEIGAADCRLAKAVADEFPKMNIVALDRSTKMLSRLPQGREQRVVATADKLPFKSNTFDFIYLVSTMKHIYYVENALSEINRVLVDDGSILVIEPAYWIIKIGAKLRKFDLKNMPNLWTPENTSKTLIDFGFQTENVGYFDLITDSNFFLNAIIRFFNTIRMNKLMLYQFVLAKKQNNNESF